MLEEREEMERFRIEGGRPLHGSYQVQGNKNAALPLIAASLLSRYPVTLRNVPRIIDVDNLLRLVRSVGADFEWNQRGLRIEPAANYGTELPSKIISRLRGGVLLFAPLLARTDGLSCGLPGGCPIGKRSFDVHWSVFEAAGFRVREVANTVSISRRSEEVACPTVHLEEMSVTATENALMLFAALGRGKIINPAREPHVFSLVHFLRLLGCEIELSPLSYEIHRGIRPPEHELEFEVPGDFLDAGTMAIASAITGGSVELRGIREAELLGVRPTLARFGIHLRPLDERASNWQVECAALRNPVHVQAGPWPLFPTDLISLAVVLATQGNGVCLVHDWMYEARMFFVDKLRRMGGRATLCDPHRVLVEGDCLLKGTRLESPDIRAGMAMVVAGLSASGVTLIEHAEVIKRGYADVVPRLRQVGANIDEQTFVSGPLTPAG